MAGNALYALTQWGMLVTLAKLGTKEMVGLYALGLSITAPVMILLNLNLRSAQATDARREFTFADYLGLRLASTTIAFAIILGISVAGYGPTISIIIGLVALAKTIEAISDIFYGLMQQHERMDLVATSMILKGVLSLGAFSAGIWWTKGIQGGILGTIAAWLLILLSYDIPQSVAKLRDAKTNESLWPEWNFRVIKRLIILAIPLGFSAMLVSLVSNVPRYFLERFQGVEQLGVFAAMVYIMQAGNVVVSAAAQSGSPRLAKLYATHDRAGFIALTLKLLSIAALLGGVGILAAAIAGPDILTVLYSPEYARDTGAFLLVMVASGLSYVASILGYSLTAAWQFKVQPLIFGSEVLMALGASLLLIPRYGLLGAAWVMVATNAYQITATLLANVAEVRKLAKNDQRQTAPICKHGDP